MTSLMVANKESIVHPAKKPETPEEKLARQNARNAKLTAYNLDIKQSIVHAKPEFIAFVEH
ncbi:hypothetical protein KBC03_07405 [Patescibacteria group bacterium]|nr:hypothetical protein [Patescibacteria group bacterium]